MRGPQDERILAAQIVEGRDTELAAQRIPGGSALVRLIHLLEARGYESLASAAIDAAVPDDARDSFYSRAEQFTSAPTRRIARRGPPREEPAAQTIEPTAPQLAESIAREHIAAVQQNRSLQPA